jgi:glycosyltransferase involved in cell wall biosynthesis
MKTLLLSTSDLEGGAARATYRLHQGLQSVNVDSRLLVQNKCSDRETIIGSSASSGTSQIANNFRLVLGQLPMKLYPKRSNHVFYSLQWLPDNLADKIAEHQPEVINLHWICNSYLQIETLAKLHQPLVWTLHDMWPFTGGCHYSDNCERYLESCGACPQLGSTQAWDLSRWVWQRKQRAWNNLNLTVVAPSSWLAKCASSSSLFQQLRVETIANGIDTQIYRPIEKHLARKLLGLSQDRHLVIFGSVSSISNKRKGFQLLQPALQQLSQSGWKDRLELIIFGASQPKHPPDLGFPIRYLGTLNDDPTLALAYSAADVFVLPSMQDNLPNTIVEALACGTPCVAFKIGGIPDLIEHQQNGYLVEPFKIDDLAVGIKWTIENAQRHKMLVRQARERVERDFNIEIQARRYLSLFNEVVEENKVRSHGNLNV